MTWGNQPQQRPQPRWGQQAPQPAPTRPLGARPAWARKRIILPAIVVSWFIGVGMGAAGGGTEPAANAKPVTTVTAKATVTATVTANPKPAATVTVRATKTVRATVTAKSGSGSGGTSGGSSSVYYANCSEVRAAGAAPIHQGEPGYRSGLDRDGDGTACDT